MDTRTGKVASPYACPPRLLAPAIVEEWLTADEIGRLSETNALVMARRRWVDARDEYTRSVDADARHLRARAAQLCGPVSRPVWAKDTGQPWHAR